MQDDVVISRRFREVTEAHDEGIVCGFGCHNFGSNMDVVGRAPAVFLWYSFQCIRLPNEIAAECAEWFYSDAQHRSTEKHRVVENKHDDYFFRMFLLEKHRDMYVEHLKPSIVDHIDYLIGGTTINKLRSVQYNRARWWEDDDLVAELAERLKQDNAGRTP